MASSDSYDMFFEWPSTEPQEVIVTGTFDKWSRSKPLNKTARGFVGTVQVPWAEKIKYKFVVDGKWVTLKGQPTEADPGGYVNNVFYTPSRPRGQTEDTPAVNGDALAQDPEPSPEQPVVPSESQAAVVDLLPAPVSTNSRLVIVPLNSTEHNTIGTTQVNHPPDFVLPPSPRAAAQTSASILSPIPAEYHTALSSPVPESEYEQAPTIAESTVPETSTAETPGEGTTYVEDEAPAEPPKQHDVEESEEETKKEVDEDPVAEALVAQVVSAPVPQPIVQPPVQEEPVPSPVPPTPSAEETATIDPEVEDSPVVAPKAEELIPGVAKQEEPATAPKFGGPAANSIAAPLKSEPEPAPVAIALPTPPATPSKKSFPRISPSSSPSKNDTVSSRKKRSSIFGKIKNFFHHDKDKEKNGEKSKK
ncbi:hypothetical protein FA15DRAFT_664137 [Coprinopsis marcescibilis]|uniref:AMP-activated protein kinase glycogen-binding domain-containing protein n=1 Tax=Coprinopsis marcescibilis TaxID=230819 RepID=A0A5C3L868_COPMA|nr:hypothetical protein FA15DRAFT_664137 [Coprinopsis marcescibilis]